jgi:thiol:disulfide interchange protein DsbD
LFEVNQLLPSTWMNYQAHHPVVNAFVSGVLAVAVASPCTAPFMGASLGLAMTLPAWLALLIFACIGLGLALPFVFASFWPELTRWMPRPGAWMVTLRQFMGFPMLATVLWLMWVLTLQTDLSTGWLVWLTLLCMSAALWAHKLRTPIGVVLRLALWLCALVVGGYAIHAVQDVLSSNDEQALPARAESQGLQDASTLEWQTWSDESVKNLLANQHTVFVDFTAAWCVTCQVNERATLKNTRVLQAFREKEVVLLKADWTRRDPQITQTLTALGRSGVPVYVIYRPGMAPAVLSELLTVKQVLAALDVAP